MNKPLIDITVIFAFAILVNINTLNVKLSISCFDSGPLTGQLHREQQEYDDDFTLVELDRSR